MEPSIDTILKVAVALVAIGAFYVRATADTRVAKAMATLSEKIDQLRLDLSVALTRHDGEIGMLGLRVGHVERHREKAAT